MFCVMSWNTIVCQYGVWRMHGVLNMMFMERRSLGTRCGVVHGAIQGCPVGATVTECDGVL